MKEIFYLGGYGEKSISVCEFDKDLREVNVLQNISVLNASYLVLSKDKKFLYCVNEVNDFDGHKSGGVTSYKITENENLEFLNAVATGGTSSCHLSISDDDNYMLIANYQEGSLSIFKLLESGEIGAKVQVIEHFGKSINKERQEQAHVHFIQEIKELNAVIVCDLGIDKLVIYNFNSDFSKTISKKEITLESGSGPRHAVFNKNTNYLYVINELSLTVDSYNTMNDFEHTQTINLVDDFTDEDTAAAIRLSQNQKYLYCSVRGQDIIVVLEIINNNLVKIGEFSSVGKIPRDICFNADEEYLVCACQDSNEATVLEKISVSDYKDSKLKIDFEKAICVLFKN